MTHEIVDSKDLDELARQYEPRDADLRRVSSSIDSIDQIPNLEDFSDQVLEWAIDQFVPMSAVSMFSGDSGSGKTTLISALIYQISIGGQFLGRRCHKHPVLCLDCENTFPVVRERFERIQIHTHDGFKYWGSWFQDGPPSAGAAIVLKWVMASDPKPIIVVDSLVGFHPGAENDSSETRRYMAQYRMLANYGAAVVLAHHSGKSETSKDYRGSSDIKAGIDIGYSLTNLSNRSMLGNMRLRAFKTRFSALAELSFQYVDGLFRAEPAETTLGEAEQLIALLRQNPGIHSAAFERLACRQGLGRNRARDFVSAGIISGQVLLERGNKNQRRLTLASTAPQGNKDHGAAVFATSPLV